MRILIQLGHPAHFHLYMYGSTKAEALHAHYPQTEYEWVYAASDSKSDLCWMKEFKQYDIIDKQ